MQIEPLEIKYTHQGAEVVDNVFVRRLPYRKRSKLFTMIQTNFVEVGGEQQVRADVGADFTVKLIAQSLCDSDGKDVVNEDRVDEWSDDKINAYRKAIREFQSPTLEQAAKNS